MVRGSDTKANILEVGLRQVRKLGFESLSIGELAKNVGMSKSGLFAHFKSKEHMQVKILDYAAENFVLKVVKPALKSERGLPRLEAIVKNWISWSSTNKSGGCPLITASIEFDDRPGKVREATQGHLKTLVSTLSRSVFLSVQEGHLRHDTDCDQIAYELFSKILGFHLYKRLLNNKNAKKFFTKSVSDLLDQHKI